VTAARRFVRRLGGRLLRLIRRVATRVARRIRLVVDPPDGERALRRRLISAGGSLQPRPPDRQWKAWVNTALQSNAQVDAACEAVAAAGLPPHGERPKNWDLLVALGTILDRIPRSGAVLEMGATQYARLLPWLYLYGYRSLRGIDLVYDGPLKAGPIRYDGMDLTRTTFPDASFDAIATLSVVEHGVDLDAYLREAARLLKPGGLLITSTDYWCEPVDTGGQEAYGGPIRIFGPADMLDFASRGAAAAGFVPIRGLDLDCDERAVEWKRFGLRYTFVNVVLEKASPGAATVA
jgi:SAM-dependent methyltransferase